MANACVFDPDARLELIEGEIVEMAPIGSRHAGTVNILIRLLIQSATDAAIVSAQNPIVAGDLSMPQPDVALLRPRADSYRNSHPTADDVLLLIEVAETTLKFDLGTKVPLYARAGIAETWVVDLGDRAVRVFRNAAPGGYRTSFTVPTGQVVAVEALPKVTIDVGALFES